MNNDISIDKDSARVIDLLGQIKELNKMIGLHKKESQDSFMVNQYQDMKNRFLEELKEILSNFEIEALLKNKAA